MSTVAAQRFEANRSYLKGIAYRMLGSIAEAEDVVQDAYLRFQEVDQGEVADARAYLSRVVARLALDHLKSARMRREQYVGVWLPEPLVETEATAAEIADDLSIALLLVLERLSPLERASFLLHDVFDMNFGDIAEVLQRPETACRQLAARARAHVHQERHRYPANDEAQTQLAAAFFAAASSGDANALAVMLAEDAVLYSDGGGKRRAALNPILGRDRVIRFLLGVRKKQSGSQAFAVRSACINGLSGFVLQDELGLTTLAVEARGEQISALYLVLNPDKLRHLS